jgi:hypothetical protein
MISDLTIGLLLYSISYIKGANQYLALFFIIASLVCHLHASDIIFTLVLTNIVFCYRRLSVLRENFCSSKLKFLEHDIPLMALTATATFHVREDILKSLKMSEHTVVVLTSFFRPNLRFTVSKSFFFHVLSRGYIVVCYVRLYTWDPSTLLTTKTHARKSNVCDVELCWYI